MTKDIVILIKGRKISSLESISDSDIVKFWFGVILCSLLFCLILIYFLYCVLYRHFVLCVNKDLIYATNTIKAFQWESQRWLTCQPRSLKSTYNVLRRHPLLEAAKEFFAITFIPQCHLQNRSQELLVSKTYFQATTNFCKSSPLLR